MFLYFVPTGGDLPDYPFEGSPIQRDIIGEGPGDGRAGTLYCDRSHSTKKLALDMRTQTWRKLPKMDAWVGWYTDDAPTIDDVKRQRMVPGRMVGDMEIPVSRSWNEKGEWVMQLPFVVDVNDEGNPVPGDVVEYCRELWDLSCEVIDAMEEELAADQAARYAWQIIAANYRVGPVECAALKLLEVDTCFAVINAFLEIDRLVEVQKKSAVDTVNSSAGDPVGTPVTAQPNST